MPFKRHPHNHVSLSITRPRHLQVGDLSPVPKPMAKTRRPVIAIVSGSLIRSIANSAIGPTRRAITPTPTARTTPAVGSETAMTSVSTRRGIPERKRPISPDASENPPSKKHRSGPQSGQDPTARILFPSAPHNQAAADRSHTRASTCAQPNENEPPSNLGGGKLSERHVSSQTSDGSFRDSPRRIPRVPLGHADTNRV